MSNDTISCEEMQTCEDCLSMNECAFCGPRKICYKVPKKFPVTGRCDLADIFWNSCGISLRASFLALWTALFFVLQVVMTITCYCYSLEKKKTLRLRMSQNQFHQKTSKLVADMSDPVYSLLVPSEILATANSSKAHTNSDELPELVPIIPPKRPADNLATRETASKESSCTDAATFWTTNLLDRLKKKKLGLVHKTSKAKKKKGPVKPKLSYKSGTSIQIYNKSSSSSINVVAPLIKRMKERKSILKRHTGSTSSVNKPRKRKPMTTKRSLSLVVPATIAKLYKSGSSNSVGTL